MTINEAKETVYKTICYIQELSGRALPTEYKDNIIPIGDIEGFDSINAVEVGVYLSESFNCALSYNPFVSGNRPLTIEQIAQKILSKKEELGK
jgi:acyl carrier protein